MKFTRTDIEDVIIIAPKVHGDDRGYFVYTEEDTANQNSVYGKSKFDGVL